MKTILCLFLLVNTATAAKLSPSIYFTTVSNEIGSQNGDQTTRDSAQNCTDRRSLVDARGTVLAKVCKKFYKVCVLEGSCMIYKKNGQTEIYNYDRTIKNVPRFIVIDSSKCPFGLGVKGICLDPFYTIAGDLNHHKPGEVIFVPKMKGTQLPTGETHDGYFIVRDRGGAIVGPNRFDFFTGSYTSTDPENSFSKLGFAETKNHFVFEKITGNLADKIRKKRNYPLVPEKTN